MDVIKEFSAWMVAFAGFFVPLLFAPQVRLLHKKKHADHLSLGTVWGSFIIQSFIALDAYFKLNWQLMFLQLVSMTCLVLIISQTYYYRRFPGGK